MSAKVDAALKEPPEGVQVWSACVADQSSYEFDNTATNDGTINPGEYAAFSSGINTGFGNVIGKDSKLFIDSGADGRLNFGFLKGSATQEFDNLMVIYIDSVPGGLNSLATITDKSTRERAAISGKGEISGSSALTFAPGFTADYAIAISAKS